MSDPKEEKPAPAPPPGRFVETSPDAFAFPEGEKAEGPVGEWEDAPPPPAPPKDDGK